MGHRSWDNTSLRALRAVAPPLIPGLRSVVFGSDLITVRASLLAQSRAACHTSGAPSDRSHLRASPPAPRCRIRPDPETATSTSPPPRPEGQGSLLTRRRAARRRRDRERESRATTHTDHTSHDHIRMRTPARVGYQNKRRSVVHRAYTYTCYVRTYLLMSTRGHTHET